MEFDSADYIGVANAVAREAARFTPQLFCVKDHSSTLPPKADSTSVLVTVANRYFLLTAAHCLHGFDLDKIGVMIGDEFITIGGDLRYFEPNDLDSHDPDKVDMAVCELTAEMVEVLSIKY